MRIHHFSLISSPLEQMVAQAFPKTCLSDSSRAVQLTAGSLRFFLNVLPRSEPRLQGLKPPFWGELDGGAEAPPFRLNRAFTTTANTAGFALARRLRVRAARAAAEACAIDGVASN